MTGTTLPASVTIVDLPVGTTVTGVELMEVVQTSSGVGQSVKLQISSAVVGAIGTTLNFPGPFKFQENGVEVIDCDVTFPFVAGVGSWNIPSGILSFGTSTSNVVSQGNDGAGGQLYVASGTTSIPAELHVYNRIAPPPFVNQEFASFGFAYANATNILTIGTQTSGGVATARPIQFVIGTSRVLDCDVTFSALGFGDAQWTIPFRGALNFGNNGLDVVTIGNDGPTAGAEPSGQLFVLGAATTDPAELHVYNRYGTGLEWATFGFSVATNVLTIGTQTHGTPSTTRPIQFVIGSTNQLDFGVTNPGAGWTIPASSGLWFGPNGSPPGTGNGVNIGNDGTALMFIAGPFDNTGMGTKPAGLDIYNTSYQGANWEIGTITWSVTSSVLTIGTQKHGTGVARNMEFIIGDVRTMDYGVTRGNSWSINGSTFITGIADIISTSSNSLAVGPSGATNPVLNVDSSSANASTGIDLIGQAAGGGMKILTLSPNANESLSISAKGTSSLLLQSVNGIPSGGATGSGINVSSVQPFGFYWGTGVPTLSAGTGSIYLRNDATNATTRLYINTNGAGTWTSFTTIL
jgi:hypothetical protein